MAEKLEDGPRVTMASWDRSLSCQASWDGLLDLFKKKIRQEALLVIWSAASVSWAVWDGNNARFAQGLEAPAAGLIYELRLFNEKEELHLQRIGAAFRGRYVVDGEGQEETPYVDSLSRFWGERDGKAPARDGFVTLRDADRKITMTIPAEGTARFYGLTTRNYVTYDKNTGQAGYSDYRFVSIAPVDRKEGN